MATLAGQPTFADMAKILDPDGKAAKIGELLNQDNAVLDDINWRETNDAASHVFSVRTSLPTSAFAVDATGTSPDTSSYAQNREATGIIKSLSEVPKEVAEYGGQLEANLLAEGKGHIEDVGQVFSENLFYGNPSTTPLEFRGFAPRYNSISSGSTIDNVVSGSGSGSDNSSIWLVGWAEDKIFGVYPKGSKAGLEMQSMGLQQVTTTAGAGASGARMLVYQTWYIWACGLVVQDWRFAARACNIDISNLTAKSSAADLYDLMIRLTHRIPNLNSCRPVFYVNRTTYQMLDIQGRDDVTTGGGLTYENLAGRRVGMFRGIPVRLVDQLTEAEATIS